MRTLRRLVLLAKKKPLSHVLREASPLWQIEKRRQSAERAALLHRIRAELDGLDLDGSPKVQAFQDELLRNAIERAAHESPYYARVFAERGVDPHDPATYANIPVLTKSEARTHAPEILTKRRSKEVFTKSNTSGSTGTPLIFYVSKMCSQVDALHQRFLYELMGYEDGDLIVAFDGAVISPERRAQGAGRRAQGAGRRAQGAGYVYNVKSQTSLPYGRYAFSAGLFSDDTAEEYMDTLEEMQPAFIRGYPSFVSDVAVWMLENNRSLSFKLKDIQLTSERSTKSQHDAIAKAFGCSVNQQYGLGEGVMHAWTDPRVGGEYVCSPFYGVVEVLDSDGSPVEPGEVGEVVVTGLHNPAFPFIRYNTGDLATLSYRGGGVVRLADVQGRTQDYLVTPEGKKVYAVGPFYHHFPKLMTGLKKWQIHQTEPGKARFLAVIGEGFGPETETQIKTFLHELAGLEVEFVPVDRIEKSARGKERVIVQHVQV